MKWDIDKALQALEDSSISGTSISRVTISGVDLMEKMLGKLTAEERKADHVKVWCLGLGKAWEPKHFIHARSIHEAIQKARKEIRTWTPELKELFGVKTPRKPPGPRAIKHRPRRRTV